MKCEQLRLAIEKIKIGFSVRLDERSGYCIIKLPFKDMMGDYLIIRAKESGGGIILDDAGLVGNILFDIRETYEDKKSERLAKDLVEDFGARYSNFDETIEIETDPGRITGDLLGFSRLIISLDGVLRKPFKEKRAVEKPHKESLGPRASQKLRKSLKPLIKAEQIDYRVIINGLTVPEWLVDIAYKPIARTLVDSSELIVVIAVDLAVTDPLLKSSYAYMRAVDIRDAHKNYDIRLALDTHGQNSSSANAAEFLKLHERDREFEYIYKAIDISKKAEYDNFVIKVRDEVGII